MTQDTIERYACYHKELGYLRFKSYSQASVSSYPDPRGMFTKLSDAEKRRAQRFWVGNGSYKGERIIIRKIRLRAEVIEEL